MELLQEFSEWGQLSACKSYHKLWSHPEELQSFWACLKCHTTKGQIILKRFFLAEDSSKKRTKIRRILVKTNSFVRFLGESSAWLCLFEINWPLGLLFDLRKIFFSEMLKKQGVFWQFEVKSQNFDNFCGWFKFFEFFKRILHLFSYLKHKNVYNDNQK